MSSMLPRPRGAPAPRSPSLPPCLRGFLLLFSVAGCSTLGVVQPSGRPVTDVYQDASPDTLRVSEVASPFAAKKPVPVLSKPEVFAVFAPARLDRARDVLVGEHWILLKLSDAEWFLERGADPEPGVSGAASEGDLGPLRSMRIEGVLR